MAPQQVTLPAWLRANANGQVDQQQLQQGQQGQQPPPTPAQLLAPGGAFWQQNGQPRPQTPMDYQPNQQAGTRQNMSPLDAMPVPSAPQQANGEGPSLGNQQSAPQPQGNRATVQAAPQQTAPQTSAPVQPPPMANTGQTPPWIGSFTTSTPAQPQATQLQGPPISTPNYPSTPPNAVARPPLPVMSINNGGNVQAWNQNDVPVQGGNSSMVPVGGSTLSNGAYLSDPVTMGPQSPAPRGYIRSASGGLYVDTPENRAAVPHMDAAIAAMQMASDAAWRQGGHAESQRALQSMIQAMPQMLPQLLSNSQSLGRLGLDQNRFDLERQQTMGMADANGNRIPGAMENAASNARANMIQAQNTPRAEDVAADQAAEAALAALRGRGMDEATAVAEMRRTGQRLPRRLGGVPPQTGTPLNPGAAASPQQNQTPISGYVPPPGSTGEVRGRDGPTVVNAPPLPPVVNADGTVRSNAPPNSADAFGRIATSFDRASTLLPKTPVTAGGPAVLNPYTGSNASHYHEGITSALAGITDDDLRNNWSHIENRLNNEFGGPSALNDWINATRSPWTTMSSSGQAQQAQIQRILRMAGMRQTPIQPNSTGASAFLRLLSLPNTGNWMGLR